LTLLINLLHVFAGLLMVVAWLLPDHYLPWGTFYQEYLAFSSLLLLFLAEFNSAKRISAFTAVFFLAIVWICVQLIWGTYLFKVDAWMAMIYLSAAFLAYQIGLSTPNKNQLLVGVASVILVAGLISVLIGLCQWLGFTSSLIVTSNRAFGNLAQPNNYATLLFWGLCSSIYLFISRSFSWFTFALISTVIVCGIVLSESRTSLLQIGCLFLWTVFGARQILPRRLITLVPVIVFYLLYFSFPVVKSTLLLDEQGATRLVAGDYSARSQIWTEAIHAITQSSWLGYGWGQVSVAQFLNSVPVPISIENYVEHSHNIVLDLLIWNGPYVGGLIVGLLVIWLIRHFCSGRRDEQTWFLLACLGGVLVHACLEFPLEYAFFLLPSGLMIGLIENGKSKTLPLPISQHLWGVLVLVPSLFLMVAIWIEYGNIEEDHRVMRAQNFGLKVDADLTLVKPALILDGQREFIRFARTKARANMTQDELSLMKNVAYRYSIAIAIYRYSVALALNGSLSESELELRKIETIYGKEQYQRWRRYWQESLEKGVEI
jgi:O-antigen ligase